MCTPGLICNITLWMQARNSSESYAQNTMFGKFPAGAAAFAQEEHGLGLSFVKEIASLHRGGWICITGPMSGAAHANNGAVVSLWLPCGQRALSTGAPSHKVANKLNLQAIASLSKVQTYGRYRRIGNTFLEMITPTARSLIHRASVNLLQRPSRARPSSCHGINLAFDAVLAKSIVLSCPRDIEVATNVSESASSMAMPLW